MRRRRLLATAGLGVTTATGGYLSQFDVEAEQRTASGPDENSPSRSEGATRVPSDETVERDPGDGTLDGGRRGPHRVFVANPTGTAWTVTLTIEQDGTTLLEESFAVEPDGATRVAVTDISTYTVEAIVHETGATATETVDREQFDCNATSVTVEVGDEGSLSSSTFSTLMACGNVVTDRVSADEPVSYAVRSESESDDEAAEPRTVVASNPTAETRTARLVVDVDGVARFDGVFTLEPDATADVLLAESDAYAVSATVLDTGVSERITLRPDDFDCNAASTEFALTEAGEFETSSVSTALAC